MYLRLKNKKIEYTPKDGDLYYAIQHANIDIIGVKNNNSWNMNITISDTYDFTEWRKLNNLNNAANDLGYLMQKTGLLSPYEWDVSYSIIYGE